MLKKDDLQNPEPGYENAVHKKRKRSGVEKWWFFTNLLTIPALAFYFYVGLDGHINGYFILLIAMVLYEYVRMKKWFEKNRPPETEENNDNSANNEQQDKEN